MLQVFFLGYRLTVIWLWLEEMQFRLFRHFLSRTVPLLGPSTLNSSEFFGPEAVALFSAREKEKQQDGLVQMAMVPPKSSGLKRKSFWRQTGGQAKKHKPASASQPSLSQPQATPCPSFISKEKGLPRSQSPTTFNRQHPR